MRIGIPREIMKNENRVAALPETIQKYIKLGFDVIVETCAGKGVFVRDREYQSAGATIAKTPEQVFQLSDILLKVNQPVFNDALNVHEIDMLREDQILIALLDPAAPASHCQVTQLMEKGVTTFTMDGIPKIPRAQCMDPLMSMSAIAGYKSMIMAASQFPGCIPVMGTPIERIKPVNILVVGTGVAGLQAIAAGKGLGGSVTSVDIRPDARKQAESLGVQVTGFDVPPEMAVGEDGYAKALSGKWIEQERAALGSQVAAADIVILSAQVPGKIAPVLVTKQMVASMNPGSVIMDVAIDQGGNCEVTVPGRESVHGDVYISGIKNIPGLLPVHSSWMYANNLYYFLENLFKVKIGERFDIRDEIIARSLVTHMGRLYHEGTRTAMGLGQYQKKFRRPLIKEKV